MSSSTRGWMEYLSGLILNLLPKFLIVYQLVLELVVKSP